MFLDQALTRELASSLSRLASEIERAASQVLEGPGARPTAVFYSTYYDLALACRRLLSEGNLAAQASGACASPNGPRFTTLSADFYTAEQIRAIVRWLDTEPENSLDLGQISKEQLSKAQSDISRALRVLELGCPPAHGEFTAITRELILAQPAGGQRLDFRGVSSFALWGALALNPLAHPNWFDYLPSLVHESAHSILFAIARKGPLVLNDPSERFYSPLRQSARPMDGIFHAAFVSAREAWVLGQCVNSEALRSAGLVPRGVFEHWGQLRKQSLEAFRDCLEVIRGHGRLTALGAAILADAENHGLP